MAKGKWFRRGGRRAKSGTQRAGRSGRRSWLSSATSRCALSFETLEERRVLAVFMVTNLDDLDQDGNTILGSLRWAVERTNANGLEADVIVFADNMFTTPTDNDGDADNTIVLNGGTLTIGGPLRLLGPGPRKLEVANDVVDQRVFMVDDGNDDIARSVEISGIEISGGNIIGPDEEEDKGGGIYNKEALLLNEVLVNFNSASQGGDGIYVERGSLQVHRSFIDLNPGFNSGVGIEMGGDDEEKRPFVLVANTTIAHHGVGIFNRKGTLRIENSTITDNFRGVHSWGNPRPDDPANPPPPRTVFTNIYNSIIYRNGRDVDRIGTTDDGLPLLPSVTSVGYNFIGNGNITEPMLLDPMGMPIGPNPDWAFDPMAMPPMDQTSKIGIDPLLSSFHTNNGGSTDVYMLNPMSPAIDAGDPSISASDPPEPIPPFLNGPDPGFEQRGRHFTRVYDWTLTGTPRIDVGAVEVQKATFVVDTLIDEFDDRHSKPYTLEFIVGTPLFTIRNYEIRGDFSLREALEFARLNPGPDVIRFTQDFLDQELRDAEDINAGPATITLTLGALTINTPMEIIGPDNFILEIDASGNDPSPGADNSTGTRVFFIDDQVLSNFINVSIQNLTLMGADAAGLGGAIFSRENLMVKNSTFKENSNAQDGAAIYVSAGSLTAYGSTFSNNLARRDGGAIFVNSGATARISNSTFSGNRASVRGGAIGNNSGTVLIEHSTITLNNAATNIGHGVVNLGATSSTSVFASVIANNGNNTSDVATTLSATPSTFTSLGYNFVGKGNALGQFSSVKGDITNNIDPKLGPLFSTGGLVETHLPLTGSPLIDAGPTAVTQLITPTAVTSTQPAAYPADNLINDSGLLDDNGLPATPTYEDFTEVIHADADATNAWATNTPTMGVDYFVVDPTGMTPPNPKPDLVFALGQPGEQFSLTHIVVWGFPELGGISGSEAQWMFIEFSLDGGTTWYNSVRVRHELTAEEAEVISLDGVYWADTVRVTVYDNYFFPMGPGGDRVGLGEVKFLTNAYDNRGFGFDRVFDGDSDGVKRVDIGAYEVQGVSLVVSGPGDENDGNYSYGNLSLREAIELSNRNPLPDVISFDPGLLAFLDFQNPQDPTITLGGTLFPGTPSDIRITDHLTINGPGLGLLAIDAGTLDHSSTTITGSRMFTIDDGQADRQLNVTIRGLEFRDAVSPDVGSVFFSRENLTLEDVRLLNNRTEVVPSPFNPNPQPGTALHGGAVYQDGGSLTIVNSEFTSNRTIGLNSDGGGIYVNNGVLDIRNSFFIGNLATLNGSDGGAIALNNSTLIADGAFISGNQVGPSGAGHGGGIYSNASVVTLDNTFLTGNSTAGANSNGGGLAAINSTVTLNKSGVNDNVTNGSQSNGAGMYVSGGSLVANGSQFAANRAVGQQSVGGALFQNGGTVTFNASTIVNNEVSGNNSHGGGVYNLGGDLTVRNSTLTENRATHSTGKGGAIYSDTNLSGQTTLVLNSTVSGNSASLRGGGIFNADGRLDIKHSTITNNSTNSINTGSGVASFGNAGTTLTTVFASIVAGNVGAAGGTRTDIDSVDGNFANTVQSLGFNVIGAGNVQGSFGANDKKGILDPGLAALANNGGLTATHALLPNSPAINSGPPPATVNNYDPPLTTDQAGNTRVVATMDVGAFESAAPSADFDGDSDTDGRDFLAWQRNLGKTSATHADGDADRNGTVNAQDLNVWKKNFSAVEGTSASAAVGASIAASSGALQTAALHAGEDSISDSSAEELSARESWRIGSLGTPAGAAASDATASQSVEEPANSQPLSSPSLQWLVDGYSILEQEYDFASLALEAGEIGSAEDEVFADWGARLL